MNKIYQVKVGKIPLKENQIYGKNYRITLLTDSLIRFEYDIDGQFEDRATQMVFFRDFPKVEYRVVKTEDGIEIHTEKLHVIYDEKKFSPHGLRVKVKGNLSAYHSVWNYGDVIEDLGGTARTLDMIDGAIPLERGILSKRGFSVIDDSCSQVLLEDGWIEPRKKGMEDFYFFGYGHEYKQGLKDFYKLCGCTPLLPRYALGNWWSRYYKYSEETYMQLMDRFEKENLPFSVAVIDMDWHLVDIDPKYGSGWTGYTWNKELFPNPKRFLQKLHERGMKITLNVHPADGVQGHEEMYEEMAKELGVNAKEEDPILFDASSKEFLQAYFKYLHHPREDEGVDFWWIDWQQGSRTKVEGLDPLWILNHYHFLDNKRNGKRPMTFSRYAGVGSHRYPIGFSGDTITTWESLDFQPYFTLTASNIGYGWWSHDIGGHMMGYKDDEMVARWTQYGIFSPIMRLHSSCSEFNGKEPWRFKEETNKVMGEALRERHRMIPYLYTMNYRNYKEGLPLITPLYYEYPEHDEAYQRKNQFFFGSKIMVAPITSKRIERLNVAKVDVWFPKGLWYDLYTGMMYEGNRTLTNYRFLDSIPVFAKAGSILTFTNEIHGKNVNNNPTSFVIKVFAGDNGQFELYEDDNETCQYEENICVKTLFEYEENRLVIHKPVGNIELLPEKRSYTIELYGYEIERENTVTVKIGEKIQKCLVKKKEETETLLVEIPEVEVGEEIEIVFETLVLKTKNPIEKSIFHFLNQAEIEFTLKDLIYTRMQKAGSVGSKIGELYSMKLEKDLYGVLIELLTAKEE